jgi:Tripartite tricarboxylate transporter family receptor
VAGCGPLAVASCARWPDLPHLPTLTETDAWTGVLAPAGTPRAVVPSFEFTRARCKFSTRRSPPYSFSRAPRYRLLGMRDRMKGHRESQIEELDLSAGSF